MSYYQTFFRIYDYPMILWQRERKISLKMHSLVIDSYNGDSEHLIIIGCHSEDLNSLYVMCYVSLFIAPTVAPSIVSIEALNSSSVSISWSKPDKSVLHGILRRYDLEYRRVECNESDPVSVKNNSWNQSRVANTSSRLMISGLEFWSCYELKVRAVTIGEGPFSVVQQVRTLEHGELLSNIPTYI